LLDPEVSDQQLMQAVGSGNHEAFGEIVRRYQTWAWRIAYRFLGHDEDAADVVQEAFLRLLDASGRYQPSANFTTYFYRIITRLCLDRAKKMQPLYVETTPDSPDPQLGVLEEMLRQETGASVRAALDSLPPNQRMAILLHYFEEPNYSEIASALETTPKSVERLLARGRQHLRAILGARDNFSPS